MRSQVESQVFGCHDADFLSFFDFFMNECAIKECEKLKPLMNLAENCGWWTPFEDVCILQEKPIEIHMENGLLHNIFGPSVLYKDGFCVYSLNGERVSYDEWFEQTKPYHSELAREIFKKV